MSLQESGKKWFETNKAQSPSLWSDIDYDQFFQPTGTPIGGTGGGGGGAGTTSLGFGSNNLFDDSSGDLWDIMNNGRQRRHQHLPGWAVQSRQYSSPDYGIA